MTISQILRDRLIEAITDRQISKHTFCIKTEFSEEQWYAWTTQGSTHQREPSAKQLRRIFVALDISPSWYFIGVGPYRASDLKEILDVTSPTERATTDDIKMQLNERIDRLEDNLRKRFDAIEKQKFRAILHPIDD